MRVIKLTYKYDEVTLSYRLSLFFRMMGVHVVEQFYEPKVDMQEYVDVLRSDFADVSLPAHFSDFDTEIYILRSQDDFSQIQYSHPHPPIILAVGSLEIEKAVDDSYIQCNDAAPNFFSTMLYNLIQAMYDLRLLDEKEFADFRKWADIYAKDDFSQTVYQLAVSKLNDSKLESWIQQYYDLANKAFDDNIFDMKSDDFWRDPEFQHTKFALLDIQFNINEYSKNKHLTKIFDAVSLLHYALVMDQSADTSLKSAVNALIGKIYYYLLDEKNKAYDYYLKSCIGTQDYNHRIFLSKGKYWQYFIGDYDKAQKCYYQSLLIYPDYFRAWYNLGYCCYRQGEAKTAVFAFRALIRLLEGRLTRCNIKPLELKLYFGACKICAQILHEKYADINGAIELYLKAEEAWKCVDHTTFWELLNPKSGDPQEAKENLREKMDIHAVWHSLYTLSSKQ